MKPTIGRPKASIKSNNRSFGPLADLIRKQRIARQLGLSDIAKACNCSAQFISNIEHGRASMPWDKTAKLAKVLGIPQEEIQAANLTIRADFKSIASPTIGKRVKKPAYLRNMAATLAVASQDSELQEVIQKYQGASKASREAFLSAAVGMLG